MKNQKPDFSDLAKSWPSAFVARSEIGKFSGGMLNSRHMANLDSQGTGIPGRVRCGRKVAYPVKSVIEFMEARGSSL